MLKKLKQRGTRIETEKMAYNIASSDRFKKK